MKGQPVSVSWSWSPNRKDIFAVGRDDRLWHNGYTKRFGWDPSPEEW